MSPHLNPPVVLSAGSVARSAGSELTQPLSNPHPDIERAGLAAAVEQSADAILITDAFGTIQFANPAFSLMTGYSREEAVGQNPRVLKSGSQPAWAEVGVHRAGSADRHVATREGKPLAA
jgi:PAS domain-containing protein